MFYYREEILNQIPPKNQKNIFARYRDNTETHRRRISQKITPTSFPKPFKFGDELEIETQNGRKKENNMFKDMGAKMIGRMFRKVDDAVWDLQTGKIGIHTKDGIVTLETSEPVDGAEAEYSIAINIMDEFGMPIPAFAQNTPTDSIKPGDLIFSTSKVLGYVIKKTGNSFRILKLDGQQTTWTPPKVTMIGLSDAGGVLVLRSLFNTLPGGEAGMAGLQGMLMPMLMLGGDNLDLDNMLPMLLMSQNGTMGGAAGMGNMLPMMMMMNMMKGGDSPMKNMFGGTSSKTGNDHFGRSR